MWPFNRQSLLPARSQVAVSQQQASGHQAPSHGGNHVASSGALHPSRRDPRISLFTLLVHYVVILLLVMAAYLFGVYTGTNGGYLNALDFIEQEIGLVEVVQPLQAVADGSDTNRRKTTGQMVGTLQDLSGKVRSAQFAAMDAKDASDASVAELRSALPTLIAGANLIINYCEGSTRPEERQ